MAAMLSVYYAQKLLRLYFNKENIFVHVDNLLELNALKTVSSNYAKYIERMQELISAKALLAGIYDSLVEILKGYSAQRISCLRKFAQYRDEENDGKEQLPLYRTAVLQFRRKAFKLELTEDQLAAIDDFII